MGTGSQGLTDDVAFWRRTTLAWMLIMLLETLHGFVREVFIAPVLGDLRARQLGVLVGCLIVFAIAWLAAPGWWWLVAKAFFFATAFIWFRATFPRYRYDQIMRLGWKVFIPVTLVWIAVEGAMAIYQVGPWAK